MSTRPHYSPRPLLLGYDPYSYLPASHLARLVERVVNSAIKSSRHEVKRGQPAFEDRLLLKVLVYGYATGVRSSRQLAHNCDDSLAYLFLTRGDTPSYRTLCKARVRLKTELQDIFVALFELADQVGMSRIGQIVVDASRLRADASPEAVLRQHEYQDVLDEVERLLAEAERVDALEDRRGRGNPAMSEEFSDGQIRDIVRRVRNQRRRFRSAEKPSAQDEDSKPADATGSATSGEGSEPAAVASCAGAAPRTSGADQHDESDSSSASEESGTLPFALSPAKRANGDGRRRPSARTRMLEKARNALKQAMEDKRPYLCTTDPDARPMPCGRTRSRRHSHAFEAVVDRGSGLLVASQSSQAGNDNARLIPLVEEAKKNLPGGELTHADADSGYYGGEAIASLIQAGIDTCVPDMFTASDLHRDQLAGTAHARHAGSVVFEYDPEADLYRCPQGNELRRRQKTRNHGQETTTYRAARSCEGCPLAAECLTGTGAKYRTKRVGKDAAVLKEARERFNEPEHRARYRKRGSAIETVFGVLRGTLGYNRWQLRGKEKVAQEARLFGIALQLRKIHIGMQLAEA